MPFDHEELDALDKIKWSEKAWSLLLFFLGLGFGALVLWLGVQELNQYRNWNEYIETDATIETLSVREVEGKRQDKGLVVKTVHWQVESDYVYQIDEVDYNSIAVLEIVYSDKEAQELQKNYSLGDKFSIWYHPSDLDKPIVEDKKPTLYQSIFFIVLGILVIVFLIFMAWPDSKKRNKNKNL
jgi:hypothetical protein